MRMDVVAAGENFAANQNHVANFQSAYRGFREWRREDDFAASEWKAFAPCEALDRALRVTVQPSGDRAAR